MDFENLTTNDVFVTETDPAYVRKGTVKTLITVFLCLSLAAELGFLIAWQTFVFFETVVFVSCLVTLIIKIRNVHRFELRFEGDRLSITDLKNSERYEVFDVTQSDFIINQTRSEIETDYCSPSVKNTVFALGGVKKCREIREYIERHFDK